MGTRSYDMEMEYNINFYTILLSHTITPYLIPTGYFLLFFPQNVVDVFILLASFFSVVVTLLFVRVCYVMETDGSALKQCDKFLFLYIFFPTPRTKTTTTEQPKYNNNNKVYKIYKIIITEVELPSLLWKSINGFLF